jgi:molybdopterin converting factor subunit 1
MTITIKFFALGRELVGTNALTLDLPEKTSVHDALERLQTEHPKLAQLPSFLVALNTEYAERSATLTNGDELAIIPPVSGG